MRDRRTREAAAADMRTSAKMCASAHASDMASAHAAMHTAAHATAHGVPATTHTAGVSATSHGTATAAHASERRGRSSKRGAKRGCHDAPENLVAHPNYSVVEAQRRISPHERKQPAEPNDPAMTNYKCDSF